jgi:hypothetical protein
MTQNIFARPSAINTISGKIAQQIDKFGRLDGFS